MEKKKKNEELQSRREFFKKAAKGTLPILAAVALVGAPAILKAGETPMGCSYGSCEGLCSGSCYGGCGQMCGGNCMGKCTGSCGNACTGCYGSCTGTCRGTCSSMNRY